MKTTNTVFKTGLLLSCAIGFGLASNPAFAADAAPAPADAAAADAPTDSSVIIVTAQRRNESIQDVPMTLQAFSADTLSKLNVTTFNDLLKFTPNVTFGSNGPGQGAIFMRGLSAGFAGNQSSASIAPFPNVALYLDDQSMQFPARNADVYVADLERVEVLEGPQGTLFGGGAQAGVVRYITNKPKQNVWEGKIEGSFGGTSNGAANAAFNAAINIPLIQDKLAIRAVVYDDHHGGYIDNVQSTFHRSDADTGNFYFNNGNKALPASQQSNSGQYNNYPLVKRDYNPIDYVGGRIAAQWDINPDWNLLVTETFQDVDAEGTFSTYPIGSDFQKLGKLQTTTFSPSWNRDKFWNTAWTINGNVGGFKLTYTGAYMTRHMSEQQDYTNYSRTGGGMYYQCTGGGTGWGNGAPYCYSPVAYWEDTVRSTHQSHEFRVATPDDKRIRAIVGAYWESFKIYDVMNFDYKTIPACTTSLIAANAACSGVVQTVPGSTATRPGLRDTNTAFGEDLQRGYNQLAFFGSVDFDILPNLTITGGTRYYNYKAFETGSQYQTYAGNCYQVVVCAVAGGGNANIDLRTDTSPRYTGFKSKGVITWKPKDGTMVYALFSQGFRPGGSNRRVVPVLPGSDGNAQLLRPGGWAPDTLTNWEAGFKTDLFDRKVTLNLSAYYMKWQSVQFGFFNPAGGFGNTSFVTNGPDYHIKGVEAQFTARPVTGLTVMGSATYNKSEQANEPCLIANNPASNNFGKCITTYIKGGVAVPVQSPFGAKGTVTPFSPEFQGNIRVRYDWNGKADINWFANAGLTYTGSMYNQPSTYPSGDGVVVPGTTLLRYKMDGYAIVDASFGFKKDKYTVTVFGENLANTAASTFTTSAQFIKAEVPVRPRIYGVKVGVQF
ncbi:TonB-dependent receptor [Novosphingobium sp. FKTRR1]|uniref:TonB-dependent receptor n=1 Tax=Novosphingobium sp. FKTRR1 TaxID=2879118 RepID=UPI001CF07C09|nr:TonB-dependent receptor [Novosphingobium sp. FKTRR1]